MTLKFLSCIDLKEFISIFHFYNELATNPNQTNRSQTSITMHALMTNYRRKDFMPHLLLRVTLWWVVIKSSVSARTHNLHTVTALQNRGSGRWGRVKVEGQTCRNWFLWSLSLLGLSLWIVNLQETRCLRLCFYGCQFVVPHNPCSATSFCTYMTLDCRPWKSHAACSARELRPVASWERLEDRT